MANQVQGEGNRVSLLMEKPHACTGMGRIVGSYTCSQPSRLWGAQVGLRKISKNAVVFKSRLWFHHRHRHRCGAVVPHLLSGGAGTTATIPRCVIYLEGRDERGPRHNCLSIWWICLMFLFSGRTLRARCEVTNNWLNNGYLLMNGNGRKLLGSRNHGKKVV